MKKLKVIQIGVRHDHAPNIATSVMKLNDIFDMVGYVLPEGDKGELPRTFKNLKELTLEEAFAIPDLDAVIVETREQDLSKYALMAAKRGYSVHMDKPGGLELSEFQELIETVKEYNSVLHLGYMYRYNPAVKKLMSDIREGKLGKVYSVEAHMDCMHTPQKRQWLGDFKGGQMFYLGCHLIDLIYTIMGEPQEIIPLNCSTGADGVNSEDYGMVVLKYKNGVSFAKTSACEPGGYMRRQLVVCGDKGTVQLCPFEIYVGDDNRQTGIREVLDNIYDWNTDGVKYTSESYNRYDNMMSAFAEYVRKDKKNPYTYDYELELYKILLKCCNN